MILRIAAALFILSMASCQTEAFTGRKQLAAFNDDELASQANQQYKEVLASSKLSKNQVELARLHRVGKRIAASVDDYCKANKIQMKFDWEFNLIEDSQVNAWCMPGGKIAFYTGILPVTQDDAGMAVVMGHEVAHALARHGNERATQATAAELGLKIAGIFAEQKGGVASKAAVEGAKLGAPLLLLKYSRKQESAADEIGAILMAKAGYDPRAAIPFWRRMAAIGGQKPPELLSTHPSDETRIRDLEKLMPMALKHYKPASALPFSDRPVQASQLGAFTYRCPCGQKH
ncbi:MAG: hypothetical protein RL095_2383 [Verrucomicrobiota bacterium]|jgi:predicted Zn-dependent protease